MSGDWRICSADHSHESVLPLYSGVSVVLSETIGARDCFSLQNPFRCLTKKNSTTEGCIYNTFHVALTFSALYAKSCVLVKNFCPYLGKKKWIEVRFNFTWLLHLKPLYEYVKNKNAVMCCSIQSSLDSWVVCSCCLRESVLWWYRLN